MTNEVAHLQSFVLYVV